MKRHVMLFAILSTALMLPLASAAAEKPSFDKADKDGSGAVTMKEAKQAGVPSEEAKANDIDGNGKLTKTDWRFVDAKQPKQQASSS